MRSTVSYPITSFGMNHGYRFTPASDPTVLMELDDSILARALEESLNADELTTFDEKDGHALSVTYDTPSSTEEIEARIIASVKRDSLELFKQSIKLRREREECGALMEHQFCMPYFLRQEAWELERLMWGWICLRSIWQGNLLLLHLLLPLSHHFLPLNLAN